jgi:hypothetical protein
MESMTHKQQAQFKAMADMIRGLVTQVSMLTDDVTILADRLSDLEGKPRQSEKAIEAPL